MKPSRSGSFLTHPVADADFSKYVLGFCGIFLQLPADVCHIDAEDLIVAVRIGAPDFSDNGFIGHDPSGVLCQQADQLIFDLGQMDFTAFYLYQTAFKVNG